MFLAEETVLFIDPCIHPSRFYFRSLHFLSPSANSLNCSHSIEPALSAISSALQLKSFPSPLLVVATWTEQNIFRFFSEKKKIAVSILFWEKKKCALKCRGADVGKKGGEINAFSLSVGYICRSGRINTVQTCIHCGLDKCLDNGGKASSWAVWIS